MMRWSCRHGFACLLLLTLLQWTMPARAQAPSPNMVDCTVTASGGLACTPTNGTCAARLAGQQCTYLDAAAYCYVNTYGVAICDGQTASTSCFLDQGHAQCNRSVPPLAVTFWSSPTSVTFANTAINTTSASIDVTLTNSGPIMSITRQVTGDFAIQRDFCNGVMYNQMICVLRLVATPRLPGERTGVLSVGSEAGTVTVPLRVTGTGLPAAGFADKNAGHVASARQVAARPSAVRTMLPVQVGSRAVVRRKSEEEQSLTCEDEPREEPPDGSGTTGEEGDGGDGSGDEGSGENGGNAPEPGPEPEPEPGDGNGPADDIGANVSADESEYAADPVHTGIGNKVHRQVDYRDRHVAPLQFVRTYNSAGLGSAALVRQDVGVGWRSGWDRFIANPSGDAANLVAVRGDGKAYTFNRSGGAPATWTSTSDVRLRLARVAAADGTTSGWRLTDPRGNVESYDALGRLARTDTAHGRRYTLAYDSRGRLASVDNGFGRKLLFGYDGADRVTSLTDPAGGVTRYAYDTRGRMTAVTYADNRGRAYRYEDPGWPFALTGIDDGLGSSYATFTYDAAGRSTGTRFAGGVGATTIAYPGPGIASVIDELGTTWMKSFQIVQGLYGLAADSATCFDCPPGASQFTYDPVGNLASHVDKAGVRTAYLYDPRGLPVSITEAAGAPEQRVTNITWHPTLDLPVTIFRTGRTTTFTYDAQGRRNSRTDQDSVSARTTAYRYNAEGLLWQVVGPRTDVAEIVTYTYDAAGNRATVTDPLGKVTRYSEHNGLGQAQRIDYPDGSIRLRTFDARGRLLSEAHRGLVRNIAYDANGRRIAESDNTGKALMYSYDAAQRLTGVDSIDGNRIRYTLDNAGRRVRTDVFDVLGLLVSTESRAYDGLGRMVRKIDAAGHITTYAYDTRGNVSRVTDPQAMTTQYAYDALNRPILVTDPMQSTLQLAYDAADRITRFVDSRGNATSYTYNGFGETTLLASPDTGTTRFTYDSGGNLVSKVDARGSTTSYRYDAARRLVQVTFADGKGMVMTYDIAPNGVGRLASVVDASGTTMFAYDPNGRVATKTQIALGVNLTLRYERDGVGRVLRTIYPSGKVLNHAYAGSSLTAMDWNGTPVATGIQYFPFGSAESWMLLGAREYTRYLDTNQHVWKYLTPGGFQTLGYDASGRITNIADVGGRTQAFMYDPGGHLLSFTGFTSQSVSEQRNYTYDANGNRLSASVNGASTQYRYDPVSNRLLATSGAAGATYGYDMTGNLVSDGRLLHTYDARGRLLQVTVQGASPTVVSYEYNVAGQRVLRQQSGTPGGRVWLHDTEGRVVGEYDAPTGRPVQELIWLGSTPVAVAADLPVACAAPPCTAYDIAAIWTDHQNTPRIITNRAGARLWQWHSAPFGDTAPNPNPEGLGDFTFNHRFPGQYYDATTRLTHNGHRDYDATLGRFIQSDPKGLAAGANTYAYVKSNPLSGIDPDGRDTYLCTRPIDLFHGVQWSSISHQYLCTWDRKTDQKVCGGMASSANPFTGFSQPTEEVFDIDRCELVQGPNTCMESCIARVLDSPRPPYQLWGPWPGSTAQNCRTYATSSIAICREHCRR